MKNKFLITITKPGQNLKEIRLILNKLNCWTQPQCDRYFDNPFEFQVELDSTDYMMILVGLKTYCKGSEYKIIDITEKRNQKLEEIGI